jgi:signal transduction histidine kinase
VKTRTSRLVGEGDRTVVTEQIEELRRQLEDELVKVAQFPEYNPGPVLRLDSAGVVLLANRAAISIFAGSGLIGDSWLEVCPGMDSDVWNLISDAVDEPVAVEAEIGSRSFTFQHVCVPHDGVVFVFGTDITERREAEQALREVARFPDMNPGPVLRMDPESTVVLSNAAAQQIFGGDLVGRRWLEVCPGIDADFWRSVLESTDVVATESTIDGCIYLFSHRHDPRTQLVFAFGTDITRHKLTERALVQSEKMATLGTLAAGVAHELNNPAAAARRAAEQLADAFQKADAAHVALNEAQLSPAALAILRDLESRARTSPDVTAGMSSMERADAESRIEEWLEDHDIPDAWELAPALVCLGVGPAELDGIASSVEQEAVSGIVTFAARTVPVYLLASEIGDSSARISEIVNALRGYSFLGLAPGQDVDVHRGLDDTLVILNSKITPGRVVRRNYEPDLPLLPGYGGELNQVWTHLIDNAIDAIGPEGEITISTRRVGDEVEVEIADDGPGIAEDVVSRVFDPFFTTKPQGQGTGLGLSTCYSIVTEQHGGSLAVSSSPGHTTFTVRLPLHPAPSGRDEAATGPE